MFVRCNIRGGYIPLRMMYMLYPQAPLHHIFRKGQIPNTCNVCDGESVSPGLTFPCRQARLSSRTSHFEITCEMSVKRDTDPGAAADVCLHWSCSPSICVTLRWVYLVLNDKEFLLPKPALQEPGPTYRWELGPRWIVCQLLSCWLICTIPWL